jgi:predicted nucleic acid-binding protein
VRVALDTNILVYAEGANGLPMMERAVGLIEQVPADSILLPVQSLGELYQVLVRKVGRSPKDARATVIGWRDAFSLIDTTAAVMITATGLAADHRLQIWDAVIVAAAAGADCRLLLSEDLQDGFSWNGITVANPFAEPRHSLLEALLGGASS